MPNSEDYRLYLNERFDSITTLMNAQFKDVHERLDGIHEQTTKTNGSLTEAKADIEKLKIADVRHIVDCPAIPKIDAINESLIEYKWFKMHPKLGFAIIAIASALIIFNVFGVIQKNMVAKNLVIYNKEQLDTYRNMTMTIDSLKTLVQSKK